MNIGDTLPRFTLLDQDGNAIDSQSLLGAPLVVYFYPKDDTPGCTAQACSFRDQYEDFRALGARVVGISNDGPQEHKHFAQKYRLPFTLLADTEGAVRRLFGVPRSFLGLLQGRVTYVFDAEGKLLLTFNSQLQTTKHVKEALKALQM